MGVWGSTHRDRSRPLVWFHAPSVGEGLQAKPVIERLRAERPDWQIAYTFFSPSAASFARQLAVDYADYLPFDRPRDVVHALEALAPTALVYGKLDVWPELTLAARRRGVRTGLVAATVAPQSSRLAWPVRGWAAPAYAALEYVGAIATEDAERLEQLGARPEAISVTGDTRYDSVTERAARLDRTRPPFAALALDVHDYRGIDLAVGRRRAAPRVRGPVAPRSGRAHPTGARATRTHGVTPRPPRRRRADRCPAPAHPHVQRR
jgi:3-deoxy-D-manno-octulosonic-acid transferase